MKIFNSIFFWLIIFIASYTLLLTVDLAPIEVKELNAVILALFAKNSEPKPTADFSAGSQPIRLVIEKIGTDA